MNKLGDIINLVKNGERPPYEDLRYAICAMDSLMTFDSMLLRKLAHENEVCEYEYIKHFERRKNAYNKTPKEWIGWENDPENENYVKSRNFHIKLFNKKIVEKLEGGKLDD